MLKTLDIDSSHLLHLLEIAEIREKPKNVERLLGGRNNRAYRVDFEKHDSVVLKHYFSHPQDDRDRLGNEYKFLTYAKEVGIKSVAAPLAADPDNHCGLYSYIKGRQPQTSDVSKSTIDQFINFFCALNSTKATVDIEALNYSSEACLCLNDYAQILIRRITRLKQIEPQDENTTQALLFIENEIVPAWEHIKKNRMGTLSEKELNQPLTREQLCITPSDFGFHNVIMQEDRVNFIDFEYAGWDDPAKTITDVFCQPQIPIPDKYLERFVEKSSYLFSDREWLLKRVNFVYPFIVLKWVCLLLNPFVNVHQARRAFAENVATDCLVSAKKMLEKLGTVI